MTNPWHAIGHGKQGQAKPRSKKAQEKDSEVRAPEARLEPALACDLNGYESREAADRIAIRLLRGFSAALQFFFRQKLSRIPNCAANGIPTVVPGPKKSPKAPAGTLNWFKLVIGRVWVQPAFKQNAVAFAVSFTGNGS